MNLNHMMEIKNVGECVSCKYAWPMWLDKEKTKVIFICENPNPNVYDSVCVNPTKCKHYEEQERE